MKLQELTLRMVRLPLIRPYVLSYRTFTEFEPIIVEARDSDGRSGWGEGHISPGSSRNLFDHLVGEGEQLRWNIEAEHLGGRNVDDQLILSRQFDRQVARP